MQRVKNGAYEEHQQLLHCHLSTGRKKKIMPIIKYAEISRDPWSHVAVPPCITEFTTSTARMSARTCRGWKFRLIGLSMHQPTMTQKGVTKRAIWQDEPTAIVNARSNLLFAATISV